MQNLSKPLPATFGEAANLPARDGDGRGGLSLLAKPAPAGKLSKSQAQRIRPYCKLVQTTSTQPTRPIRFVDIAFNARHFTGRQNPLLKSRNASDPPPPNPTMVGQRLRAIGTRHLRMYPTKEEFEELLRTREVDWIIDKHLFGGPPFYSSDQPDVHDRMIRALSTGLKVPRRDICVVGSARIGFSLSPPRFGEPFSQFSDIDIVVVSSALFDPSWLDILGSPRRNSSTLRHHTRRPPDRTP